MYTPENTTYYKLDASVGENSLDKLAEAHFGRRYNAVRAAEPRGNDVIETVYLENDAECLGLIDDVTWTEDGTDAFHVWATTPDTQTVIGTHTFPDDNPSWPDPRAVMAKMVLDKALPYGKYLLSIWW